MTQDEAKRRAAEAALACVSDDSIVGVGTGSTVNYFIEGLAGMAARLTGALASSRATAERLRAARIPRAAVTVR